MSTVKMYELIKETGLSEAKAEALVEEFEKLVNGRFNDRKELLATKVDLADTKTEIITQIGDRVNRTYRSLLFWIVIMGILNALPEVWEKIFQ